MCPLLGGCSIFSGVKNELLPWERGPEVCSSLREAIPFFGGSFIGVCQVHILVHTFLQPPEPVDLYLLFNGTVLASDSGLDVSVGTATPSLPPPPSPPTTRVYQCIAINPVGCINTITTVKFEGTMPTEDATTPTSRHTTPPMLVPEEEASGSGMIIEATPTPITDDQTTPPSSTDHVTTTDDAPNLLLAPQMLQAELNPLTRTLDISWSYPVEESVKIFGFKLNWDSPARITQSARDVVAVSSDGGHGYVFAISEERFSNLLGGVALVYVWAFYEDGDGPFAEAQVELPDVLTTPAPGTYGCTYSEEVHMETSNLVLASPQAHTHIPR